MMVLLDTNVVSETTRRMPNASVLRYLSNLEQAFVSVLTVHELHYGIRRLPPGRRRTDLATTVDRFLATFTGSIIDLDRSIARRAGDLRADAEADGRVLHLVDALIAATALERRLQLVTRNVTDFNGLDVAVINPWITPTA